MEKALDFEEIKRNDELRMRCQDFYEHVYLVKRFGDHCDPDTFTYLFGEEEGKRLWHCFVMDAKRDMYNLYLTYLTSKQKFILTANILDNKDLRELINR